jgi:hypothetical protein
MEHIGDALKERNIILETSDPVVAEGFTQVPNFILKNSDLTVGEKMTFAMFLSYAWNKDCVFPGQERQHVHQRVRKKRIPHDPAQRPRQDEHLYAQVSCQAAIQRSEKVGEGLHADVKIFYIQM